MFLKELVLLFIVTCHASKHARNHHPWNIFFIQLNSEQPKVDRNHISQSMSTSYEILKQEWKMFKETYNKKYQPQEDIKRMEIFAKNKLYIERHNELYAKGVVTSSAKINQFGDMTTEEFEHYYALPYDASEYEEMNSEEELYIPDYVPTPKEKDWRKEGAVTKVKDQGNCKSCWAFSTTGALEAFYFIKTKRLEEMSEQNLIDCTKDFGNFGCDGGWPRRALKYVSQNHGIDPERSYPYRGVNANCRYNSTDAVLKKIKIYGKKVRPDETSLLKAVTLMGPVTAVIDVRGKMFKEYHGGVHYDPSCSSKPAYLTHAVLIVGYGTDVSTGRDYWLVKNSWGESWGDKGYIKMARNENNNCGIATSAYVPLEY